jgi:hypothetical protein
VGTTATGAIGIGLVNGWNYSVAEGSGLSYFNLYRQANSAATIIANGYKYSSTANGFASSTSSTWAKTAIALGYGSGVIAFFTNGETTVTNGNDVTPSERMRITSDGKVGIGTSAPVTGLSNTASNTIGSDNQGNSSGADSLAWAVSNTGYVATFWNGTDSSTADGIAVKVRSTACVALDVSQGTSQTTAGTSRFKVLGDGTTTASGNLTAAAFFESSDERLKNIIFNQPTQGLGAIQYIWKNRDDKRLKWGYSAQEVQKYLPDAVDETNGYLTVEYNQVHTYKIMKLEEKIKQLETELENLKS